MNPTASPPQTAAPVEWTTRRERSQAPVIRFMVWLSLLIGRRASRVILYGIALYFLLFSPAARRSLQVYYGHLWGRHAGWRQLYRHFLAFATVIHDRVFLLSGQDRHFVITLENRALLESVFDRPGGAVVLGAHFGSFELLRCVGQMHHKKACMLMYAENATRLNTILAAMNPDAASEIIAMNRVDSMLEAHEKLQQGAILGMLADRNFARSAETWHGFLGAPAAFPSGPLRLAAMLRCPVIFMAGIYLDGNRYHVHAVPLADFSECPRSRRAALIDDAQAAYVAALDALCRQHPHNWFNFHDFWKPATGASPAPASGNPD